MIAQYARNPVVKNYLYRLQERQKPIDVTKWYSINENALPTYLQSNYKKMGFDKGTESFLDNCYEKADWVFTQIYHAIFRSLLSWFMSMTTVNGFLNRGSMFVFSKEQFQELLNITDTWKGDFFLDLGAGDGKVTENILHHFHKTYATEQSPTMRWRLQEKGFEILEIDEWVEENKYSVITALNLLDRIDHPYKLLGNLRKSVRDDGYIVLAIVLPYKPCYENGPSFGPPEEILPVCGNTIEEQIKSLHDDVFASIGLEIISWTKLPYLCEGDLHNDFFVLNDIVFVLKKVSPKENKEGNQFCKVTNA